MQNLHPILLIPDALCVAMCVVGVATDVRRYRIPNWLTLGGLATAVAVNLLLWCVELGVVPGLKHGLGGAAIGAVSASLVFAIAAGFGYVGMGDVKLLAAAGGFVRWPLALPLLVYVMLAGGGVAVVVAIRRRRLVDAVKRSARLEVDGWEGDRAVRHRIPYAVAILIGVAWAVTSRYMPALRIIG